MFYHPEVLQLHSGCFGTIWWGAGLTPPFIAEATPPV